MAEMPLVLVSNRGPVTFQPGGEVDGAPAAWSRR